MKISMTVYGRVQGVAFRYMTKIAADELGVCGIVRNLDDGGVYIEANGDKLAVQQFIEEVKKSPAPMGKVTNYSIDFEPTFKEHHKFNVVYS
ncbi:acylphosphatase [Vagococcus bubulae]|uniref:acylphosphatase n=1 Tax=Vagococcus bubulae TaxID=1977868 RepID=A0A429ZGN2_9ENTE|nr:acylphosphatase [Vagococcus bubulae]RST92840.1 acylphosphatase [Vagococcus bubulae]